MKSYATHSQSYNIYKRKLSILKNLQESKKLCAFDCDYKEQLQSLFISEMRSLNNDEIEVQYNMAYVSKYRTAENWDSISDITKEEIEKYILPLLPSEKCHMKIKSFDMLMYVIEDEYMRMIDEGKDPLKIRNGFVNVSSEISARMKELLKLKTIPAIIKNEQLIRDMIDYDYLYEDFSLEKVEKTRLQLRDLMQYLPNKKTFYIIDIPDVIYINEDEPSESVKTYDEKAFEYIQKSNNPALAKLRNLDVLTDDEKVGLQDIFFKQLGTEVDYNNWSGNKPLLPFLRLQVGISDEAIQTKLGSFYNDTSLNDMQKSYMNQIIDYARTNGDISFMELQRVSPFCDYDIIELFGDKVVLIKNLINDIHKPVQ